MSRNYILITRPEDSASVMMGAIEKSGFRHFSEPVLKIMPLDKDLPNLSAYQALIFTSANAVRCVSPMTKIRDVPIYTVGPNTAETAISLGWTHVKANKRGGVAGLSKFLRKDIQDKEKPLLHLSGEDVAGDINPDGLDVQRIAMYKAEKSKDFSAQCCQLLENDSFDSILFFSTRTAESFVALIEKHHFETHISGIKALCISNSVLKSLEKLSWKDVQVSKTPDRHGMLELLRRNENKAQ